MLGLELSVLRGFVPQSEEEELKRSVSGLTDVTLLLELFFRGDFKGVVHSPVALELLCGSSHVGVVCEADESSGHVGVVCEADQSSGPVGDVTDVERYLQKRLKLHLDSASDEEQRKSRELVLLLVAVSSLQLFAQSNWTGPDLDLEDSDLLPPSLRTTQVRSSVLASLLLDGESVYPLVSHPLLLLLPRLLLSSLCSSGSLQLVSWWTLRCLSLHQQILEACSPQLFSLAQSCITAVEQCDLPQPHQPSLLLQFHLECVYINLSYYDYSEAKRHMRRAEELSGLRVQPTGVLGKRTRFQSKSLAQLVLKVTRSSEAPDWTKGNTCPAPTPVNQLPKDCDLNDDTRLEKISLEDPEELHLPQLSAEEQGVLLGLCTDFQKNSPQHRLTEEQLLSFTPVLLSQPQFWSVEVCGLMLRTQLERGQRRCVERAMAQTQVLVDYFHSSVCSASERLKMFYVCRPPPTWTVQKALASLLVDLGCTSSALLTFEKLQMWEEAVICLERLGQHGKAEQILRRQLQVQETPGLWCLLGDVLRDHEFYDRAWELSKHRSARAMRSKGLLHLQHLEVDLCVRCFQESLRINRMQLGLWFSLGCGFLTLQNYEGAAEAFQSCVCLEPDNAEAWNNLSTAYIRLKKDSKAFLTLKEALKCNYESWQIWENFLLVCTNVGAFQDAIRAYNRLMDLREDHKDTEVLSYLVRAVVMDLPDRQGAPSSALRPKLQQLLGRVSARHSSDADVWAQYSHLYGGGASESPDDNYKALQFLSKAHRIETQKTNWHQDPVLFRGVLQRALSVGQVSLSVSRSRTSEALQILTSSRLSLNSLMSKAKQLTSDPFCGAVCEELKDELTELTSLIAQIQEESAALRSQSESSSQTEQEVTSHPSEGSDHIRTDQSEQQSSEQTPI